MAAIEAVFCEENTGGSVVTGVKFGRKPILAHHGKGGPPCQQPVDTWKQTVDTRFQ
jgi:hypothetical protein